MEMNLVRKLKVNLNQIRIDFYIQIGKVCYREGNGEGKHILHNSHKLKCVTHYPKKKVSDGVSVLYWISVRINMYGSSHSR